MFCLQGFPVMGVWEDGSDRTDINAVARAKSGQDTFDANKNSVVEAERCAGKFIFNSRIGNSIDVLFCSQVDLNARGTSSPPTTLAR